MAQNTFFGEIHAELDAKMVPCGKWNLPLFYPGGAVAEHRHAHSAAVIFDRSAVECFQIAGSKCAAILDRTFLRPVADMPVGSCRENAMLHDDGTFAMIFTLCRMQEDDFMLLSEAGTPAPELAALPAILKPLTVKALSGAMAQLALAGSKSAEFLAAAGAETLPENGHWQMITLLDDEGEKFRAIAMHSEHFGEPFFHLCCNADFALEVYGALYRIAGVAPAGTAAWESLRIESGEPALPNELKNDAFPADCGLDKWVDMSREFTGKTALSRREKAFRLWQMKFDRHPALPGTVVNLTGDIAAGVVTSSAFCPVAGAALAICRMDENCGIKTGDTIHCMINGKMTAGTVSGEVGC